MGMTEQKGMTIKDRVRTLDPDGFAAEIDRVWRATEQLKDVVVDQVRDGQLQPVDALEVLGCVTSRAFGSSQPSLPQDLVSALSSGTALHR